MKPMNKKGGFTDVFIFIIMAFIIMLICGVFIYIGVLSNAKLHETMDNMTFGTANTSQVITATMGQVNASYQLLYWISWFLIIGMIIASFMGSYMVSSKPVYMIPYILLGVIAFLISVAISNAYGTIMQDKTLGATFQGMVGGNFLMGELPLIVLIIIVVGGVLMFTQLGKKQETGGLYG